METKITANKIVSIMLTIAMLFSFIAVYSPVTEANAASSTTTGFYVDGTKVRDANGNVFVMRGVNHAYVWYASYTETAIRGMASRGANSVRLVLGDGEQYDKVSAAKVESLINTCLKYKVIPVLEVHDATGKDSTSSLTNAVNYWIEIKDVLKEYEKYVIVNIANEWMGSWNGSSWASGYKTAIKSLRNAGIDNMLVVDAPGWGQNGANCVRYCQEVFNADANKNTMFSIHMYGEAGGSSSTIKSHIDGVLGKGVPLMIGEFGHYHSDGDVNETYIMQYCEQKGVGYLGWSWKGNGGGVEYLDIAKDWAGSSLSSDWGEVLFNNTYGITKTAETCSVFTGSSSGGSTGGSTSATTTVIWEGSEALGSWDNDVECTATCVGDAVAGGTITLEYSASADAQIQLIAKIGDNWTWTVIPSSSGEDFFDLPSSKSSYSFELNSEQADMYANAMALFFKGQNATITKYYYTGVGGSTSDSSSTTDEEPEGEHLIFNETIKTDSWTTATLASIDFTGYKYARIELTATSAFNNFILNYGGSDASYYVGVKSLTAELNGSTLAYKTLPKMSELQNKTTTIKADGQANTYTLKVYASKTGETGDSSIVDDSSSTVDPIPTGTPELLQNTFTLDGMIGANFDYSIPRGFVYGNYDIKAIFKSANETLEVAIDTNKTVRVDGTKAYRFTLPVKSCDLTEPFAAKLVIKDAEGEVLAETEVKEFAVNDYLKVMRYIEDANLRKLASALQTYGYYSQQMFNTDAELPVTKPNDVSDVKASTLVDYKGTISVFNGEKKVNLDETTLTVEAETAIRFYIKDLNGFDADELYLSYTVNGNTEKTKVKYSASKDMYYGEIPNIGASKLANMYTAYFVVNDEQVSDSVNYGAYSYIFEVIRYSEDATHKNLARALYKYSLAAQEYQDSLPEEVEGELDTTVTNSTKENFGDYEGTISNVDIDGNKLYSQDDLVSEFGSFGNLYDKDLYNDGCGSDVGIAFCGWNIANYIQDPTLDYKLDYFRDGSEHNVNRMTFIPTYFLDTYEEGIKVGGKNTLTPDEQADIMAQALNMNVRLNYRLHIDPQRFAPDGNSYSKVDTSVPGSQWWRGEFTEIHPMGDDYLAMIDEGFEALEKTMRKIGNKELVEPIRFDIGAELMTSVKNFTSEWIELVDYCRNKIESSSLLRDKVILSYNFCHHIEYLIEIEGHADYFGRINGTGVTYKDRADLLFVDDMTEENKQLLAEFITSLDTFTISQYMPMDIFAPASLTDTNVATTAEDVRDALLTHEQNFLQKVLIGKLGIAPEEIPPFHLGEYGMGIKGLTAPNVWDRTAWTDAELATYKVQQEHAKVALEGLMLYMQDERSVAKSLSLWISGAPYDVINFYPGMNVGDAGHGYPGQAAYNAEAAQVLKDYWNGRF